MRIQHLTDCHFDINHRANAKQLIKIDPTADVIALTGDMFNHAVDTINWIKYDLLPITSDTQHIVYIFGNHEFYGISIEKALLNADDFVHPRVHFLKAGRKFELDDVCFIGDTLWTDFEFQSGRLGLPDLNMFYASQSMSDFSYIEYNGRTIKPAHTVVFHHRAREEFVESMRQTQCKHIVVLSHHGPCGKSVSPRFFNDSLNAAFVSEILDKYPFPKDIDLWLHGHVHDSFDYLHESGTRVVCNPIGYLGGGVEGKNFVEQRILIVGSESSENEGTELNEPE